MKKHLSSSFLTGLLVTAIMAAPLFAKDPPVKTTVPVKDPAAAKNTTSTKTAAVSKTSATPKQALQSDLNTDNKKLVTEALNLLYKGDTPAFTLNLSSDFIDYNGVGDSMGNIGSMIAFSNAIRTALPDLKFQVEDVQAGENTIFVLGRITGSYTGPYLTNLPTGNKVNIQTAELFKIEDKLIRERRGVRDILALYVNDPTLGAPSSSAVIQPISSTLPSDIIDSTRSRDTKPADGVLKVRKGKGTNGNK